MTNPINDTHVRSVDATEPGERRKLKDANSAPRQQVQHPQGDRLDITDASNALRGLSAEGPAVDEGRVESIKTAIREGRYPIDAERIAERLIEFERLLEDGDAGPEGT